MTWSTRLARTRPGFACPDGSAGREILRDVRPQEWDEEARCVSLWGGIRERHGKSLASSITERKRCTTHIHTGREGKREEEVRNQGDDDVVVVEGLFPCHLSSSLPRYYCGLLGRIPSSPFTMQDTGKMIHQ